MDASIYSIVGFVISLIVYMRMFKPKTTLDDLSSPSFSTSTGFGLSTSLLLFLLFTLTTQVIISTVFLANKCGGNTFSSQNILPGMILTLIPWIFLFGILVAVIIVFPSLKNIFSNVVGYLAIKTQANDLIITLLQDATTTDTTNEAAAKSAEAIMKICSDKSLLINQIDVRNFNEMWDMLGPLMKPTMQENVEMKQKLLDIVCTKENIGEAIWYIYGAILVSSIVFYNLSTRACRKSAEQIKKDHDDYLEAQEKLAKETKTVEDATTYVY